MWEGLDTSLLILAMMVATNLQWDPICKDGKKNSHEKKVLPPKKVVVFCFRQEIRKHLGIECLFLVNLVALFLLFVSFGVFFPLQVFFVVVFPNLLQKIEV